MKYVRIFLLHFQEVFDNKGRSFVWFLIPFVNIAAFLLFWIGAYHEKGTLIKNWSLSSISSYYLILLIISSLLIVHIEENVARYDIQLGGLSKYLTKPFSYFWFKFFEEIPWRIIQGSFGIVIVFFSLLLFGNFLTLKNSLEGILLSIVIAILGFFISFIFKMILGLSALWITDYSGLEQMVGIVSIIFSGLLLPIEFFPQSLQIISYMFPFSYVVYFPVIAFSGRLILPQMFQVILIQALWIGILYLAYLFVWNRGIRKFTAFGQ